MADRRTCVPPRILLAARTVRLPERRAGRCARQFGSTEHLSIEAIAAFVDGELRMTAHLRAAHHLSLCTQCAAEVEDQSQARTALPRLAPDPHPQRLAGLAVADSAQPDRRSRGHARTIRPRVG